MAMHLDHVSISSPNLYYGTFGGTNELLSDWMGCDAETTIPVKFNGKAVGVWEVCVGMADDHDNVIRRPAAASVIPDDSKYRRVT